MMACAPLLYPFQDGAVVPRYDFDFSVHLRDVLDEDFQLKEGGVIDIFHETRVRRLRGLHCVFKKEEEPPSTLEARLLVSSRRIVVPLAWVSHVHVSITIDGAKVRQFYYYRGYINYDLTFFNIVQLIFSALFFRPREVMLSRILHNRAPLGETIRILRREDTPRKQAKKKPKTNKKGRSI